MQLLTAETSYSCLTLAFAMATGRSHQAIIDALGFDGSEVVNPLVPDPGCRRGVHVQELIDVCINFGFSCTPIELFPVMNVPGQSPQTRFFRVGGLRSEIHNWTRFAHYIYSRSGVIECARSSGFGHAVAFERGTIFDPSGSTFRYFRNECERRDLITHRLWLVDKQ